MRTLIVLIVLFFPVISLAADFTFVAWGDTRQGYPNLKNMSPEVSAKNPDFLIFTGDLESEGFTPMGMETFINAYNGGGGSGLSEKTFFVRGNHDSVNTSYWEAYFNFSAVAVFVGARNYSSYQTDRTYSFDYGNSHFVGLDVLGGVNRLSSSQISWLNSDLSSAESRGVVNSFIFLHGPPYCADGHCSYSSTLGDSAPTAFWNTVNNHTSVKVLFAGHEHIKARTLLNNQRVPELSRNIIQMLAGAAGAPKYSCSKPMRYEWCDNNHGYTVVEVTGGQIRLKTYNIYSSTIRDDHIFGESYQPIPLPPDELYITTKE